MTSFKNRFKKKKKNKKYIISCNIFSFILKLLINNFIILADSGKYFKNTYNISFNVRCLLQRIKFFFPSFIFSHEKFLFHKSKTNQNEHKFTFFPHLCLLVTLGRMFAGWLVNLMTML